MYALFAVLGIVIFFWFSFHQNGMSLSFFARDSLILPQLPLKYGKLSTHFLSSFLPQ